MDRELFVHNVEKLCKIRGVFPTVACRESGAGNSFISDIKRGRTPAIEKFQQLASYLGVSTSELLGERYVKHVDGEVVQFPVKTEQTTTPKGSGLSEEFAKLFSTLTPENQNEIIAEMLRRQRQDK